MKCFKDFFSFVNFLLESYRDRDKLVTFELIEECEKAQTFMVKINKSRHGLFLLSDPHETQDEPLPIQQDQSR